MKDGAGLYVERAFINYKINNAFTFSIGRLPTIEGPSYHLQKGTARSGTYPQLAYGATLDGMALTHATRALGGTIATRVIYTPLNQVNKDKEFIDSSFTGANGLKIASTEQMYSAMVDYEKLNLGWANRFNFIAQYVGFKDFAIDQVAPAPAVIVHRGMGQDAGGLVHANTAIALRRHQAHLLFQLLQARCMMHATLLIERCHGFCARGLACAARYETQA